MKKTRSYVVGRTMPVRMKQNRTKLVKHLGNGINTQLYPKLNGSLEPHLANGTMGCGGGAWSDTPWSDNQLFWAGKFGVVPDSSMRNLYVRGKNGNPKKTFWDGMEALTALEHLEKVGSILVELSEINNTSDTWDSNDYYTFDDACRDGLIENPLDNSKNNRIFVNS